MAENIRGKAIVGKGRIKVTWELKIGFNGAFYQEIHLMVFGNSRKTIHS